MKTLLRLNGFSLLFAILPFIQSELMVNVYRLERITGTEGIERRVELAQWLIFIGSTVLCCFLARFRFSRGKSRFLAALLWFPYYWAGIKSFAVLFPITNPAEQPLPGIGLVILAMLFLYPAYIAIVIAASTRWSANSDA